MKRTALLLATILLLCFGVHAQENTDKAAEKKAPSRSSTQYKVEIKLYELENGKRINQRSFMLNMLEGNRNSLHTGIRYPLHEDNKINYMDIGLNIDVSIRRPGDD